MTIIYLTISMFMWFIRKITLYFMCIIDKNKRNYSIKHQNFVFYVIDLVLIKPFYILRTKTLFQLILSHNKDDDSNAFQTVLLKTSSFCPMISQFIAFLIGLLVSCQYAIFNTISKFKRVSSLTQRKWLKEIQRES